MSPCRVSTLDVSMESMLAGGEKQQWGSPPGLPALPEMPNKPILEAQSQQNEPLHPSGNEPGLAPLVPTPRLSHYPFAPHAEIG